MKNVKLLIIVAISCLVLFASCNNKKTDKAAKKEASSETAAPQTPNLSPNALQGKKIATRKGCMNCHTTNGKNLAGPTFKNLYGHKTTLKNGSTVVVDSAYIIQSLKHPNKKIVAGYSSIMPDYSFLASQQMERLVAYLRELSNNTSPKQ